MGGNLSPSDALGQELGAWIRANRDKDEIFRFIDRRAREDVICKKNKKEG